MKLRLSPEEFDLIVRNAISSIPWEIRKYLDNIVILVKERPTSQLIEELNLPPGEEPLGFFWGPSLMGHSFFSTLEYPNTIFIFQRPLEAMCRNREDLEREIRITVIHEIGHYLGMSEEEIEKLGYG